MFAGVLVNFATVIAGSLIGLFLKGKVIHKYYSALINVIALGVIGIGITYIIKTDNVLVLMISIILGTLIGTVLRIEDRLENLGDHIQERFKTSGDRFSEGFAAASILFCVGSMTVLGCMDSGIYHSNNILFTKSIMDGVSSMFLASAMGIGVLLSAFTVLIYQGLLTFIFSIFAESLDMSVVNEISAVGGVILIGIAVNMLKIKKIKAADMVISLFFPIGIVPLISLIGA